MMIYLNYYSTNMIIWMVYWLLCVQLIINPLLCKNNVNVNGKDYYIKEKEAIVIYPFVSHKCQPVDLNNWQFIMIYINENFYSGILNGFNEKRSLGIRKLEDEDYKKVKQMISISSTRAWCRTLDGEGIQRK